MKTTEQINQVLTLKSIIAKEVENHKETKKIARMSSLDEAFSMWSTACAQSNYLSQKSKLFIKYTTYYVLKHELNGEDRQNYLNQVVENLKPWKKDSYRHLDREVQYCIDELDKYISNNGKAA